MKLFTVKQTAPVLVLTLLILVSATGCAPSRRLNNQIYFSTIGRLPVIEGKINGKRAYFIIDTGASCSILNESGSEKFGFRFGNRLDEKVHGLSGEAKIHRALDCVVEFGPLKLNHALFRTKHMDNLTTIIQKNDDIDIAGIIGSDIFNRYQMAIDFRRNTIAF